MELDAARRRTYPVPFQEPYGTEPTVPVAGFAPTENELGFVFLVVELHSLYEAVAYASVVVGTGAVHEENDSIQEV
jgi:hypothetical protein